MFSLSCTLLEVTSPIIRYLKPKEEVRVWKEHHDADDDRVYLKLSGPGWIPVCSRKDARLPILEFMPQQSSVAGFRMDH